MKRTAMALAMTAAVMAMMAWPASAKGEGPVGATITGPGIGGGDGGAGLPPGGPGGGSGSGSGGPNDGTGAAATIGTVTFFNKAGLEPFQNSPIWRLASFSGIVTGCTTCTSYIDTSAPKDVAALGPAYRVVYFAGGCCDAAVRQTIYPFGPGGPWVLNSDDVVGTEFFLMQGHRTGWWHPEGRMGALFLRFLHHAAGVPMDNPVAVAVAGSPGAAGTGATSSTAWRLPVAIGVMALLLVVGAMAARPRSSARPA